MTAAYLIAGQSVRLALREQTVVVMAALLLALVLLSAWLGWQATTTVHQIYLDAAAFLAAAGKPVPDIQILNTSALGLMRNLAVYFTLIGALSAIVIGNRLVALDRKGGILPLLGTRPVTRATYAVGKILALVILIGGLVVLAAVISAATLFILPDAKFSPADWGRLTAFFGVSTLYILIFGLAALAATARSRSETIGILVPVTFWLTATFILPALTLNLTPTAVLNPISALVPAPETAFFGWTRWALGPFSVAQNYGSTAAGLLGYRPALWVSGAAIPPLASLSVILSAAVWAAYSGLRRLSQTDEGCDV